MKTYGLIGKRISHSLSPRFFANKIKKEGILNAEYKLFPLASIEELPKLLAIQYNLRGLNVTIPYKEEVLDYLDFISKEAETIGAVNTIAIRDRKLYGYNTDVYGFQCSLERMIKNKKPDKALILGTGGASKAVSYALKQLKIPFSYVSRKRENNYYNYTTLGDDIRNYDLIVNTTPLGMYPQTETSPDLAYDYLQKNQILYDLVYNPEQTVFLQEGEKRACLTKNGLEMLHLQAEKAWKIWNE